MNRIWQLTKVFLKTSIRNKGTSNQNKNTISRKILTIVGIIALIAYFLGIFGFVSYGMITMLNEMGQPAVFIGVSLFGVAILVLIQSLISSMNLFYFSKDVEYILPLPLKPYEIIIAKFNTLLITEYFVVFAFLLSPFVIYGIITGAGFLYYVYSLIVLLIFPILPALISSIIVMIIMSFSGVIKNKDKFQTIATTISIILIIGVSMFMTSMDSGTDEESIQMLMQYNGMVEKIDDYFITLGDSINALVNYNELTGLLSVLTLLLITVLAYIIFILIGQKIYFKGAIGAVYSGKNKKRSNKDIDYTKQNVAKTYIKKEFANLFKNSVFFTQCILPALLMPVILLVSGFAGSGGIEELKAGGLFDVQVENTIGLCVMIGISLFMYSTNFIPVTAISRDGENAVFMKYIPIKLSSQCTYKIVPAVAMNMVTTIIVIALATFVFKLNLIFILASFIVLLLFSIVYSYLMIIIDLKRPKLKWDTEYAVVKQNLNTVWGFVFEIAAIIVLFGIGFLCSETNYLLVAGCMAIVLAALIYLIRQYIERNQYKLFAKIQ